MTGRFEVEFSDFLTLGNARQIVVHAGRGFEANLLQAGSQCCMLEEAVRANTLTRFLYAVICCFRQLGVRRGDLKTYIGMFQTLGSLINLWL